MVNMVRLLVVAYVWYYSSSEHVLLLYSGKVTKDL